MCIRKSKDFTRCPETPQYTPTAVIVIITLADGCGLLGHLLSAGELARAAPRIELMRKMDLIGRAFLAAMDVAVQPAAGRLDRSAPTAVNR